MQRVLIKRRSTEDGQDRQGEEGQEQNHADKEHRTGHPRVRAKHEGNRPEENDTAPTTRCLGHIGRKLDRFWSLFRRRHQTGGPQQEGEKESNEDEEDGEECDRAGACDNGHDDHEVDARFASLHRYREDEEPNQHDGGAEEP